jgi:hypothetical protein
MRTRAMPEKETKTTATFQVEREDGSHKFVTEETTYLIHKGTGHRSPCQIEWFLDGESLIRDSADNDVFRNGITGETFRRIDKRQLNF